MKIKYTIIAVLLLMAILLGSCADAPAKDPEDPFASLRLSKEEWITYGLAAYENEKQAENLKEFFSDTANMTYLTLYDHFFTYDKEKTVPVAEALFAFIYDKYGAEALLNLEKRCEYKDEYLKSLGLDVQYTNDPEAEAFLASMDFSSDATYKYIISFDNVTYYFKDFGAGSPTQYHGFLFYNTTGLSEMIEYMKTNNLNKVFDYDKKFNFYMTLDGSEYNKTVNSTGDMYINNASSALHEAVHVMGITENDNIWLSEGICNYFGKSLGFNEQIFTTHMQLLTMAKQGNFDEKANAGDIRYVLYKKVYEDYTARGGKTDSADNFDFRLFTDVSARVQLDADTYETLGEAYKNANKTDCNSVGSELSYDQATSLILYLADTYGIEKVLSAYQSQDIAATFGKGYEELKSDWLVYLNN